MGLIVEFTGGRRCTGCGGWIDPARVRIFASAVICEACRNQRRRTSSSNVRRSTLHIVPPEDEDVGGASEPGGLGEIPADQF
jgi:hypothetical protein